MVIDIDLKDKAYKVYIDEELKINKDYVILTNTTLEKLYLNDVLQKIGKQPKAIIVIPDGEEYKNQESVNYILEELFKAEISRNDLLINLGGGVISDIGGFVASIYKRGIKHINIATTLLASVDAAVGGKTGINNAYGKNLIGTFKQPSAVYIFTNYFKTLKKAELSAAMAEVIKMAVCFDLDFYNKLSKLSFDDIFDNILEFVEKSIKIKANVVINDEFEDNLRMKLNYGHTFAHVIENETNYKGYLHGEAVAIGMVMANKLACNLGLISKEFEISILNTLKNFNLPTFYKINSSSKFYEGFFQDKKTLSGKINFILPSKEDLSIIKNDISKDEILKVLREFE
ncbi:3-dehydroquinate synthase [Campylobacter sp. RM12647]|uniref:3-dehydroquinate synthase n=1 Tax=Campylobacter sp. RM12647 TaxID=2735737 RepID=UPI001D7E30BB|nr:3-dehydroquinate synthase [Campylobacter sp. RM12647]